MYRKLMFLISLVCFVGLSLPALGANLNVDWPDVYTVSGAEEYDEINCEGTIIVPSGATLVMNDESSIDGNGDDGEGGSDHAAIIVDGGTFIMNNRLNMGTDHDAYLIIRNGGYAEHHGEKITVPDNDGGEHRIVIESGELNAEEIELIPDRDAKVILGCGMAILITGHIDSDDFESRNPTWWLEQDALECGVSLGCGEGSLPIIEDLGDNVAKAYCFEIGPCAWGPSPSDGATAVKSSITDVLLNVEPGNVFGVNGRHQVYFGTDEAAVAAATPSDPEYVGAYRETQMPVNISALRGPLPLWTTYYWKVDEFNTIPEPLTPACEVWSFTTGCVLPGDTNGDCLLNFLDYADVASTWQGEQFWP